MRRWRCSFGEGARYGYGDPIPFESSGPQKMSSATRLLIGGFLTLAVVMGVGRFYYTPLLPIMQREYGFSTATAGLIASANFAGYLFGSIATSFVPPGRPRLWAFRIAVLASVATTLAMGLADALPGWLVLRTLSGVASAFAMILAAGMVVEALSAVGEPARVGWLFGGVGFGIAASGTLVHVAGDRLDSGALWMAAGAVALLCVPVILNEVGERRLQPRPQRGPAAYRVPRPLSFVPLLANYFCEGLGYSVFATFIVAIVKARPGLEGLGDWVWVIAGLAGLPSVLLWGWAAQRIGFSRALVLAYLAQIVGVLLPALGGSGALALAGAALFGGTFMGITALTLPLGRQALNGRGFAVLTAGFGLGQMLGPLLAGLFIASPADYPLALVGSAAVLGVGTLFLAGGMLPRLVDARANRASAPPS